MNCEDFSKVVVDIAREQLLEAGARIAALDHAGSCVHCHVRLVAEQQLSRHLRALSEAMRPLGAPQIDGRVVAACRNRSTVFNVRMQKRRKTWAAAVAAVVLVSIGLGVRWRQDHLTSNNSAVDQTHATEIQSATRESASRVSSVSTINVVHHPTLCRSKSVASRSLTLRSPKSDRQGSPLSNAGNVRNEIATNFFSVGDTSALSLADGGQLVRVELPRSTLMRFGLPVDTDRASERVKADVLVGADGIARAIRFVR
jgi:hypothetical protein